MGILDDFRKRESARIDKLYQKVECMTEDQLNELVKYAFTAFYDQGLAGQAAARSLILKLNKLLKIHYVPGKGEFDRWHKQFCGIELKVKQSLLVTTANDLCKMNVFSETQIFTRIDEFLQDIPGVLADARDFKPTPQPKGE